MSNPQSFPISKFSSLPISMSMITPALGQEDNSSLHEAVRRLTDQGDRNGRPRWEIVLDGRGLRRRFRFKGFNKCWAFMNAVAEQCKIAKHHPEWTNTYNMTTITWTTHNPRGLTIKDVEMAEFCDEKAKDYDEVADEVEVHGCSGVKKDGKI